MCLKKTYILCFDYEIACLPFPFFLLSAPLFPLDMEFYDGICFLLVN